MADIRSALLDHLLADDDSTRRALADALDGTELAAARMEAKDDPASAVAVSKVLGRLVVDGAPPNDLVDAAKAAAQRAPRDEKGDEVALLAGAVIWRRSGQAQLAEPYFRRVRRTEPGHPEVLAFYRELFTGEAGATQLMQVLVQARRATKDPEARLRLAEEMAQLAEQRLSSTDRAIEVWRSVLREDGYDRRVAASLERLYRDGSKWTALVDLLKDELDRIGGGPEANEARIAKLLEIAELYRDRLKLDTMALATLQRILDIDPRHEPSLQALADTYAAAGRFNDLLGVYARRIDAARDAGEAERQRQLLLKVAEIWLEKLGNPQRALEPLAQVLELSPRDRDARELLARIHEQRRDWRALIGLRREELSERQGDEALALRVELAKLAEERLGDRREAIAAWNEVLRHHGDEATALDALARLYERESRWASAAEILHRKLGLVDRELGIRILAHIGHLYSDRLQSRDDATRVWQELLRLSPGHDKATRRLRDAYVASERWDDLTALYESQGRLADVVEVLHSAADRVSDTAERVALYRRVAALCQARLGQPERALKALERTLAIQPDNLAVARELLPIYREQKNWARLMSTYQVLLRAAEGDDERLRIIASMQQVAEGSLNSPTLTLHWAAEAYRIRPGDEALRHALEVAAERADGWDELTAIFEQRIADEAVADAERLLLLDKLAVVARDKLFKPDDAQRYFRRIIDLDPTNAAAMEALERIYSGTRRWDDLSEVYRRRLEVTADPEARLHTLRNLARIQEQQLGDLDGATDTYRRILEHAEHDASALGSLARIYRNRGLWAPLADVLERQLGQATTDATRVPLMFELAQIRAVRLQQSQPAVEGLLAVLEIEPNHRAVVQALEELRQSDPSVGLPVMKGLLPYYRRIEDRQREAEAMEVIIAAEKDPDARKAQLEQLAAIYERMEERRADALRIRVELFLADPSHWQGRQTLQRLGAEQGRMVDVSEAYEAALRGMAKEAEQAEAEGRTPSRERVALRRDLLLEHAAMLRDALGRPGDAERAYAVVLEQDETHQGAYEALEALLRARAASSELVALYRRRVDVTFNQREQRQLLSRIIDISRNVLGDRATAIRTAEELLDLIPDDVPTIELLAEMYGEGSEPSDHESLEQILGRWAELSRDGELRRRLMVRRAALRMQFLGDAFGAVDLLGQVLGEDPDDAQARRLLEELLEIAEVQLPVCALLEPIYKRLGNHEGRIRILHARRAHAEEIGSVDEAVTHLLEIARLREQELGDPATAFDVMCEAFAMDVRRRDTREHVERLGLLLARPGQLVAVWRGALGGPTVLDRAQQIDFTHRIAVLLDERLRDQEAARLAYAELLALDPPDAGLARRTVEALCRLHLEAGDGVALIEAKRALLRFLDSPAEHVRTRLEIAVIQEELGDRVGAALTYSEVLDMEADNLRSLDALERLFLEEGEWLRLCEVLEHRIGVTPDARGRAPLWRHVGEIQRDHLHDPHRAMAAFQSVLDLKVGREDTTHALSCLVELNGQQGRWPDVEEGLRRLTALADKDEDRVELLSRTAEVVGTHLGRSQDALELWKRVLDLSPRDPRARAAVEAQTADDDTRERAMRILMPLYEAEGNWPALLRLEELSARKQPSGRRRLQALLRVATTQEERIGDQTGAFGVLCEAMAEAADQPELAEILDKVERLGADDDRAQALLEAYGQTVDHILDSDLRQRVLRSMGQVALMRLGLLPEARRAYERILELSATDADATAALESIYLQQDDYEPLAQLLVSQADRAEEGEPRDELLLRAAEIRRVSLDQPEEAIRLYERLSSAALERPEVQEVLEPLYEITGRFRELAAHLNRKLGRLEGKAAVDTRLRLGRLYGEKLDDPEEGIRHLSTALRMDPDHAVATEELGRYLEDPTMRGRVAEMLEPVFAAVADWHRLIQIQEIRLADAADEHERTRLLLRIAQIEEEQLEDLDKAFESYTRLFKEQPGQRRVRDQLARLAGVLSRVDRYAEALTEYATVQAPDDDADEVLEVVREAADLWSGSQRQPERAVPLLQRLLRARPDDATIFPALESALTQAELWPELGQAYWREVDGALEESRQIEILRKLATLAQEMLEDPAEAGRAYRRILEIQPDYDLARNRLEQIYEETQAWPELVELLRDRVERTTETLVRSSIYARIADLQDHYVGDPEGAVDTLELMLAEVTDDPEAVLRLERIADQRAALRPRILAVLRPIYERQGNMRRIVEIDEWQLSHSEDPVQRHELYREIAALLLGSIDTHEAAFRALCRALSEPGPEDALEQLDAEAMRVADGLGKRAALADALVAAAGGEALRSDVDRRMELLVWAAQLQHDLGEPGTAAEILRGALQLLPEHAAALELLDACLQALGFHEELREVLATRVRVSTEDAERITLLRRLATLVEDVLAQGLEAEAVWRELLDIEPTDREALARLARAYEARGAVDELIDVRRRQVEHGQDPHERRQLRMHLAYLQREARSDRAAEIDVLRELLLEAPQDDEALALLVAALVAEERFAEATDALSERAVLATSAEPKAALVLDAARIYAGPLHDVPSALERYEQALQIVPGLDGALVDLVALAKVEECFEAAGSLVMPALEAHGRFAELADVLAARAELGSDPEDGIRSLRRLAEVRLERLGDVAGALASLSVLMDAVEASELPPVLEQAGRLAVSLGVAPTHVDELSARAADKGREPDARVLVAAHAARIAEDVLGDGQRALALLVPLFDEGLATAAVCAEVERLGRAVGAPQAVAQALREAVRSCEDDVQRAALQVRLGQALLVLGDRAGALESYRDAFEGGAGADAVAGLEQVLAHTEGAAPEALLDALDAAYVSTEDRAGQARVVERRLAQADPGDRQPLLEQLGGLYDAGGGSPHQALEAWGQLLVVDPESTVGLERVLSLGQQLGQARAVELLLAAIEAGQRDGRLTTPLSLHAAAVLLRELGDGARALAVLDRVLEADPENAEALERRVEAARAVGDPAVLHDALAKLAAAQGSPDVAAALWAEAATVAERAIGDVALAVADLEQVLALDEGHAEGWSRLLGLLTAAGDHPRLADALSRRVVTVEDADERRSLRYQLANVLVDPLERFDDAVATYQDMISGRPDDLEALRELEALLRRLERWDDVRDTLERRLELADGTAERVAVLTELARLAEVELRDAGEAIDRLQQVRLEDPAHAEAEAALERLLTAEERFVDLSDLLAARMDRERSEGDADGYRQTASRLATLLAQKLEDGERAEAILRELLDLDPGYVPALLSLAAVYDARGDDASMKETLERAAALDPQGAEGAALQLRLAELARDDVDQRRGHLEHALRLDPSNGAALDALMSLAREQKRWEQVAHLLELRAAREPDDAARRVLVLERVDLLLGELRDPDGALRVLAELYEQVVEDVKINVRIADGLFMAERYEEAKGMYAWLVEVARRGTRSRELGHYLTRLARIGRKEGDDEGAREQLLEAYRIDTTNVETLMELGALYEQQANWKESLKIFRTMLLQNADQSGKLRRGDIYVSLARAHVGLDEKAKARAMLRRGLEEDADHPQLAAELAALG